MKRKDFLRLTALGTAGAVAGFPVLGKAFSEEELASGSSFDVLIVGTGYGASVAALRMAESGKKCLMLEMGMDWDAMGVSFSPMLNPTKESTWLKNTSVFPFLNYAIFEKYTGALDRIDQNNISLYQGRGVGGGSLVNGGIAITPLRSYFEEIFPDLDADAFYNTYFPRANQGLGVNICPEDFHATAPCYQYSRVGEAEAQNAGYETERIGSVYDFDYMKDEQAGLVPKSALAAEGLSGNNHGKKDLRRTYIQQALDTGNVTILGLHRADQIVQLPDGGYKVLVTQINTKGEAVAAKNYITSKLFLGAGSLGTTKLLLKSKTKGTLPNVDQYVGQNWGNNGNATAFRALVPQNLGTEHSTMAATAINNWTPDLEAFVAEVAPIPLCIDVKIAAYIMVNKVNEKGSISYDENSDEIFVDWDPQANIHIRNNAKRLLQDMCTHNGGIPALIPDFPEGVNSTQSYHLLGGVVINEATDSKGRLNGHEGLYVLDSSLVPGQIGVNPFVTITALAEYCIEDIIANDFDGSETVTEEPINLVASPNPFSNHINVSFNAPVAGPVNLKIINWANSVVAQINLDAQEGANSFTWNGLWYLWAENYVLRLQIGNQVETIQIQKSW